MQQIVKTHELLISELQDKDLLRDYAYFIKFKYTFSSSQLNNGNRANLSRLTGLSDKTVRVYIAKFLRRGWIRKDGDHFVFIKLSRLYRNYQLPYTQSQRTCMIALGRKDSIRDIKTKLASKLIEANITRQEYVLRLKKLALSSSERRGLCKPKDNILLSIYTKGHINFDPMSEEPAKEYLKKRESKETVLSCKAFGRILNLSTSAAHKAKKDMIRLGLIEAEGRTKVFRASVNTIEKWNAVKSKLRSFKRNIYFSNGAVHEVTADHIRIVPIKVCMDSCMNKKRIL